MAQVKIRYLVEKAGANGLPRYFWQPGATARAEGWLAQRIPLDWGSYSDPDALRGAAIGRAEELNRELDAQREQRQASKISIAPSPATARTLGDLVKAYQASADFEALRPSTRRAYRQCLAKLTAWAHDAPLRAIDAPRIQKLKLGLSQTPSFANAVVRVLRLLLEHGRRLGWIQTNPATRPKLASTESHGLIWPRQAVLTFVAAADRLGRFSIGTAVMLDEWIGQREGDVIAMPLSVFRAGSLLIRQSKTGAGVALPVHMVAHLVRRIEDELGRRRARAQTWAAKFPKIPHAPATTLIVSEETGRPYLSDNFRHQLAAIRVEAAAGMRRDAGFRQLEDKTWWHDDLAKEFKGREQAAKMKRAANLAASFEVDYLLPGRDPKDPDCFRIFMEDLTFMQLRHTAVTRLAEAECEIQLIAAITGHSQETVLSIIERYMVRTAKMAQLAFQKRLDAEGINMPDTGNRSLS